MKSTKTRPAVDRCARCGLTVGAYRTERHGKVYCTAYCAKQPAPFLCACGAATVSPLTDGWILDTQTKGAVCADCIESAT